MTTNGTSHKRKVVIVTGGASGIGLGITTHFASQSHAVAIFDIHTAPPPDLLLSLTSTYPSATISYHTADISNWDSLAAAFASVYTTHGRIDTVMANAGISREESLIPSTLPTTGSAPPSKPNLHTMDVNLTGTLYTVKFAIHYLLLNPPPPTPQTTRGTITITASNAGIYAFPVAPLYGACKAALVNLVRSLAPPLAPHAIRVNGLAPAVLATNIAPKKELFDGMVLTPMSTLVRAVEMFEVEEGRSGEVVEVHGESVTVREVPGFVDADSEANLRRFWGLGYA